MTTTAATNFQKLMDVRTALNAKFFEREKEIDAILIALLSRQHVLFIGSPGTAKSALASELSKIVEGMSYFQWLLTRFSTPEELFGPLSLKDLEQGVYKRNTAKKLPEAHLAFLDEIFKSNSAILNSLLTLINERVFYNNGGIVNTPLISIVGSSNEYPEEGEGLEALFDRFLLRFEVDYIGDDQNFISMLKGNGQNQTMPTVTINELTDLQFYTSMVAVPEEVYQKLAEIRMELKNDGIRPSDRRFKQSISVLQAKALLEQRQVVAVDDIVFLENALWEDPSQKELTSKIVRKLAQDSVVRQLEECYLDAKELENKVQNDDSTDTQLEVTQKLKVIMNSIQQLETKNPNKIAVIEPIKEKISEIKERVVNNVLGI